jgi:putative transposase
MSLFMRKLNMGYAKYFNEKYKRPGILWQGTFKKILIQRDAHFFYMPFYIHLNPLDMHMYEWRTGDVKNARKALTELKKYRWSSFLDYNQIKNMPSLLQKKLLADILGTPKEQERVIADIISNPDLASVADKLE